MSFETKFLSLTTGVKMPFIEHGDPAGLPVVFLHGYTDSHRSFEPLLRVLPPRVRAFALTQRGHGDASKPEQGYEPENFADDIAAFLDAAGIPAAVIVGHSMGSFVARAFAQTYPLRTLGLGLVGAFASLHCNRAVEEFWEAVDCLADPIGEDFVREFQTSTLANPVPDAFLATVISESLKVPAFVWRAALAAMMERDRTFVASGMSLPALIAWGARDAFAPRGDQDLLASALPNARLLIYPDAGHAPHWEMPMRFAADVLAWLRQIERAAPEKAA